MKLQTERIENHRAQFTIEIEFERLEEAKRKAARKISRQVRIKGFRKGKAPYGLVVKHVGESAVLEEALEDLGDALYKQALEESDVTPYGPGTFDNFEIEPAPTLVFSVPLQPEVDLKDYLAVRLDFEEPFLDEPELDAALNALRMRQIEVLDGEIEVTEPGHRVTISVDSEFVDGDPPDETSEIAIEDALTAGDAEAGTSDETEADAAPYIPKRGDTFINDENRQIILDPNEDPFIHGFVGNLIGVERGSDVEFELTIPDDDAEETIIGRRVSFIVTIKDIEAIAIPDLDDEFAKRVCRDRGYEAQDLAGLREAIREDLAREALEKAATEYSEKVLNAIVEGAEIEYPDLMLEHQIDEMIRDFEGNLQQQRLNLDDYLRLTKSSQDDLREQYHESATHALRHTLVMRELVSAQDIEISDDDFELRLGNIIAGYGDNPALRQVFDSPQMRGNIRNELVLNHLNAHLFAIGQAEDTGQAIEKLRSRMRADNERARERSERLKRFQAEDEARNDEEGTNVEAGEADAQPAVQDIEEQMDPGN